MPHRKGWALGALSDGAQLSAFQGDHTNLKGKMEVRAWQPCGQGGEGGQRRRAQSSPGPHPLRLTLIHLSGEFDNRGMWESPRIGGKGEGDGIKDNFLEEALRMPISEHRYGLDGTGGRRCPCVQSPRSDPLPHAHPHVALSASSPSLWPQVQEVMEEIVLPQGPAEKYKLEPTGQFRSLSESER